MYGTNVPDKERSEKLERIPLAFQAYREELDEKYDLYEKIVKKNRDVTVESKRIIFLLHRSTKDGRKENLINEAKERLKAVYNIITCDIGCLLISKNIHEYERAYSGGMQEFVEALSFYYYLQNGKIVSSKQISSAEFLFGKDMEEEDMGKDPQSVNRLPMSRLLTPSDYLLGIADLTGELMRKCIASENLEEPFELRNVLKDVNDAFTIIGNTEGREFLRKSSALKASLHKVEKVCYMIRVRGSEKEKLIAASTAGDERVVSVKDLFASASVEDMGEEPE